MSCRERIANLLLQENNLMQIVKLIGSDVLPDDQKLTIEIARVIRVGFLQQNAFHAVDTYVPLEKQLKMMETILYLYDKCAALVAKQVPVSRLLATGLFDELVQMKYTVPNDDLSKLDELQKSNRYQAGRRGPGLMRREQHDSGTYRTFPKSTAV